ncbi:MAG: hypothetical protein FWD15_02565 [Alphaproteobacteria bacterium]|nr:hypothetical protein [Alphaproteobacteria bacterium]
MKKLSLLALVAAIGAASGAEAFGRIENPLYRPDAGKLYSITEGYRTNYDWGNDLVIGQTIGYGITNKFSVYGGLDWMRWSSSGDSDSDLNNWNLGVSYRYMSGKTIGDVYGGITRGINDFSDTDRWTVGTNIGVVRKDITVAVKGELNFENGDEPDSTILGVVGAYQFNRSWAGSAALDYVMLSGSDNDNQMWLKLEAYYALKGNSSIAMFMHRELDEGDDRFGVRYGVQF